MRVVITEFIANGTCEVSRKSGECVRVVLEPNTLPATVSPSEFIKLLRFKAHQELKQVDQVPQPQAGPDREPRTKS